MDMMEVTAGSQPYDLHFIDGDIPASPRRYRHGRRSEEEHAAIRTAHNGGLSFSQLNWQNEQKGLLLVRSE
jgi:hypothetical protein